MKIGTVTITGLDRYTDIDRVTSLSNKFKGTEFGILFGNYSDLEYNEKYPTRKEREEILEKFKESIILSAHLCGGYVADFINLFDGENELSSELYNYSYDRVQINTKLDKLSRISFFKLLSLVRNNSIMQMGIFSKPIIQYNKHNMDYIDLIEGNCDLLFDKSGGSGQELKYTDLMFPIDSSGDFGYSGGFTPENIYSKLLLIDNFLGEKYKDTKINIDVESGVRSSNRLDLDKVEDFLTEVERFKNI